MSSLPPGWEWEGDWEVETSGEVDQQGWAYGLDFGRIRYPPQPGAGSRSMSDMTRRRRCCPSTYTANDLTSTPYALALAVSGIYGKQKYGSNWDGCRLVRRRRRTASSLPASRTSSVGEEAVQEDDEPDRAVLGVVEPGDSLPLPFGWRTSGDRTDSPLHISMMLSSFV